jgi:hypothetical protein
MVRDPLIDLCQALALVDGGTMSGAAFLRLKKLKGSGIILRAARHNRRAIQAEMGAAGSIDPSRSALNECLQGPPTPEDVAQLAKNLMRAAEISKLRKDAVLCLELVFSLPIAHMDDDTAFFKDCAAWAANQFGGAQNILSVDIHRDEAQPHCHVLVLPLQGNRLVGSDMAGNRQRLLAIQSDFFNAVGQRHGLSRAPAKLHGKKRQEAATAALERLRVSGDPVLKSAIWPTVRDAIEGDPAPYLASLRITVATAKPKLRTMAQIFTSKGKGKETARVAKPIGFAKPESPSLSCVGFTPDTARYPPTFEDCDKEDSADADLIKPNIFRVRDSDLDPAFFDPETGEFCVLPPKPTRQKREAAKAWVASELAKQRG